MVGGFYHNRGCDGKEDEEEDVPLLMSTRLEEIESAPPPLPPQTQVFCRKCSTSTLSSTSTPRPSTSSYHLPSQPLPLTCTASKGRKVIFAHKWGRGNQWFHLIFIIVESTWLVMMNYAIHLVFLSDFISTY